MDSPDNPLGYRTNQLALQKLQYYQGCAIIELRHLMFEPDDVFGGRQLNERNVKRLLTIFEIEGCGNLEPEHRVAAIIDQETLTKTLTHTNLSRQALLDPTNQPRLLLERDARLTCVYGKHRLKAGEAFGENRWLVDLYLDVLPSEALTQLREESTKSLRLTDGEIYRTLRLYQTLQNGAQEQKWLLEERSASFADSASVRLVEGLMPECSLGDRRRIAELVESKQIFPLISGVEERKILQDKLVSTPGRLISLNTLIQDTLFLEGPAKALHRLCPPKFINLRKTMCYQWSLVGTGRSLEIQRSEQDFTPMPSSASPFAACMIQLWLFGLRHLVQQHNDAKNNRRNFGWSTEMFSLSKLAILADRLGFSSDQIKVLRTENLSQKIAQGFFESLCKEEFCRFEEREVQSMSNRFQSSLRNLPKYNEGPTERAHFTTNNTDFMAKRRFNSPTQDQYEQQRRHLFLEQVFGDDQPAAQYPTPLGVTRDILFCFFGKEIFREAFNSRDIGSSEGPTEPQNEIPYGNTGPNRMETDETSLRDQTAGQPSQSSRLDPVEEEDSPSEPVEFDPHPSGTPDRDKTEAAPPLAAGFEDASCNRPLGIKNYLSVHRKVTEILQMWYQSQNQELVVVFLFESRTYYKFTTGDGYNLRSTLQDLARDHYFLLINQYGVGIPDMNKAYEEALKERLVLVAKRDNPKQRRNEEGSISADKLREYVYNYNVHTGKRKAPDDQSGKRNVPMQRSEDDVMEEA
ncbi:hypothetical protein NUU61_009361 [Penicillium alfredii]|uniref:Uncharacterized protein n=1 Tax=Penicillium alfredii TaxID=1506179 RepID=A0A9W9JXM0_9EURO|nr:uncharacterized protein NUU61_009361 [Penicillium alfredii]KAJ5084782.1 hypothetical protein NUU61_009361 [Penicillium alfredii]